MRRGVRSGGRCVVGAVGPVTGLRSAEDATTQGFNLEWANELRAWATPLWADRWRPLRIPERWSRMNQPQSGGQSPKLRLRNHRVLLDYMANSAGGPDRWGVSRPWRQG